MGAGEREVAAAAAVRGGDGQGMGQRLAAQKGGMGGQAICRAQNKTAEVSRVMLRYSFGDRIADLKQGRNRPRRLEIWSILHVPISEVCTATPFTIRFADAADPTQTVQLLAYSSCRLGRLLCHRSTSTSPDGHDRRLYLLHRRLPQGHLPRRHHRASPGGRN
jgi:hypothetical protein